MLVSGGTLLGVPAVTTVGAGSTLAMLDATGVYYADNGAEVDVSRYAAVQSDSAPDNPSTAATIVISLWQKNLIGVRLDRFCSWRAEPSAVACLTVTP